MALTLNYLWTKLQYNVMFMVCQLLLKSLFDAHLSKSSFHNHFVHFVRPWLIGQTVLASIWSVQWSSSLNSKQFVWWRLFFIYPHNVGTTVAALVEHQALYENYTPRVDMACLGYRTNMNWTELSFLASIQVPVYNNYSRIKKTDDHWLSVCRRPSLS